MVQTDSIPMDTDDLLGSDRAILDALTDGRATPSLLVDKTEVSRQTIHNRLNVLVASGFVEKVHDSGVYELVDDPREV